MPQVSRLAAGRTVATLSVWAAGWAAANAQRLGCGVGSGKRSRFGLQGGQYSGQQLRQRAALGFFFRTDGQRQTLGVWAAGWAAANARDLGCRVRCGAGTSVGVGTRRQRRWKVESGERGGQWLWSGERKSLGRSGARDSA